MSITKDINYYRTINNSKNQSATEAQITNFQMAFEYDFDSNISCKNALRNGDSIKVIVYHGANDTTGGEFIRIKVKPKQELKIGDVIVIDNTTWFVTFIEFDRIMTLTGHLVKSVFSLKWLKNGAVQELPCAVTVGNRNYIDAFRTKTLRYSDSRYTLYCPDLNLLDRNTDMSRRFIINGMCYYIESIENLTTQDYQGGLVVIELNDDRPQAGDNFKLGIANYYDVQAEADEEEGKDVINETEVGATYVINITPEKDTVPVGGKLNFTCTVEPPQTIEYEAMLTDDYGTENVKTYAELTQSSGNIFSIKIVNKGSAVGNEFTFKVQDKNDHSVYTTRTIRVVPLV